MIPVAGGGQHSRHVDERSVERGPVLGRVVEVVLLEHVEALLDKRGADVFGHTHAKRAGEFEEEIRAFHGAGPLFFPVGFHALAAKVFEPLDDAVDIAQLHVGAWLDAETTQ